MASQSFNGSRAEVSAQLAQMPTTPLFDAARGALAALPTDKTGAVSVSVQTGDDGGGSFVNVQARTT